MVGDGAVTPSYPRGQRQYGHDWENDRFGT